MQDGGSFTEEQVEYRDEDGNILNEEEVKALEGKVSFSTRYETRTRLVDADGNEVEGVLGEEGDGGPVKGTKAEGVEQETPDARGQGDASAQPPQACVGNDKANERAAEAKSLDGQARPESEVGAEETKGHEEL